MKIIWLLSFIFSLGLANQSQIVLGTFSNFYNANKIQISLNDFIDEDEKFKNFLQANSIITTSKKYGKYYIIAIEPFSDIVTQFSVLNKIKEKFKGAYILELTPENKALKNEELGALKASEDTTEPKHILIDEPYLESSEITSISETQEHADEDISESVSENERELKPQYTSPQKEFRVLEEYLIEIIAFVVILIILVVYFVKKKSTHQLKDLPDTSDPANTKKSKLTQIKTHDDFDSADETALNGTSPAKQEKTTLSEEIDEIDFDTLKGSEEGSFGSIEPEQEKEDISSEIEKVNRVKREVPPHSKISKSNFNEFAGSRILVAEDNLINQKVITGLLANTGIDIVMADDGQEALEILEKDTDFSIVLMDAHMPRIDGFEATRQIRNNPNYEHIAVVALSGDIAPDDIKKMTDAGMEAHLEKPLRMDALYDVLYAYTGEQKTDADEFVEVILTKELNGDKGLEVCGGDEEFYHEILDEFVHTYSDSAKRIHHFLDENKTAQADKLLLDIIGITANIGADPLNNTAKDLKDALLDTQEKSYLTLLHEYEDHLQLLLEDIKIHK
ncbi:response regulator [bacterium]|nr:response regulator [bacterium]